MHFRHGSTQAGSAMLLKTDNFYKERNNINVLKSTPTSQEDTN